MRVYTEHAIYIAIYIYCFILQDVLWSSARIYWYVNTWRHWCVFAQNSCGHVSVWDSSEQRHTSGNSVNLFTPRRDKGYKAKLCVNGWEHTFENNREERSRGVIPIITHSHSFVCSKICYVFLPVIYTEDLVWCISRLFLLNWKTWRIKITNMTISEISIKPDETHLLWQGINPRINLIVINITHSLK